MSAMVAVTSGSAASSGLTGVSGWFADLIASLGAPGVGVLTSVETVIPPVPSEVVLPLSALGTTLGSLSWNAVLVGLGYGLGTQWSVVGSWASTVSDVVVVALVVLLLVALVRRRTRLRSREA